MVKARRYVLAKLFDEFPKRDDLQLVEEELPPLEDGEFLVEAIYLTVDPYMRAYVFVNVLKPGETFIGDQVGRIVESKAKDFPVGKYVRGFFGWSDYSIASSKPKLYMGYSQPRIVPFFEDLPLSLHLGVLGMPGVTSYFGLLEICKPKKGETIVISGAAGAVGSHVGQIAKSIGCKVIGIAGSDEKGEVLINVFGFDGFINYKKPNLADALRILTPDGIDCYFDNVGGEISSIVLNQMNTFGRAAVCGSISCYNEKTGNYPLVPVIQPVVNTKQLVVEGFSVRRWIDRWDKAVEANLQLIREGKLKYKETVTEGFENAFDAFVNMLQGGNIGKAVVKIK